MFDLMESLHEITQGCKVGGIAGSEPVTIVNIDWHGDAVASVVYETQQGRLGKVLIDSSMLDELALVEDSTWAFDADADEFKLVSEAYRIGLAHLFDPYLAIRTSQIEPLPHQVSAVYQDMLPKMPLRFVLADDPGAGKTIMTGLLVKEMIARGDLKRCLIVCPGNLVEQWQDELYRKFGLHFQILTNDLIEASVTRNVFKECDWLIARLDKLSRNESVQKKLEESRWDLIVCDEAHKMSATMFGNEIKYTKRYHLGELLGDITENFLLLTATPHNGKPEDFQLFMQLVDRDRFEGSARAVKKRLQERDSGQGKLDFTEADFKQGDDLSDVMRRLVKEELLKFDGRPLFPERIAYTVNYSLSPVELGLYDAVTDYVTKEFNRADRLDGKRRNSVGFALTLLQRRLASSPEAIYQSLRRRRERLQARLLEMNDIAQGKAPYAKVANIADDFDEDDYTPEEWDDLENEFVDDASAAATAAELEAEIETLKLLESQANEVRMSGEDRKWDELSKLLQDERSMFSTDGSREKLIIFTEHKDTLEYLATKIRSLLGSHDAVLTIKGGMPREERHRAEEMFKQDKDVRILIATDAAGEGINLQRAHLMVNYDLPWNPNRIEQRFGRIHRIGQTEVCHLWNLVARETREGYVFERLFSKLEEERIALGGRVFDILGKITFDDRPLRDLLVEAIRYGNRADVRDRLNQVVDSSLEDGKVKELLHTNALTTDVMDVHSVMAIREDMERMEARKLEPHFIKAFFLAAFTRLGGKIAEREPGRYEVMDVPFKVRAKDMKIGVANPILPSYERVCFTKSDVDNGTGILADLVCPGHPLLEAMVSVILEENLSVLKRGSVLVDDTSASDGPRMLFYLESTICDGNTNSDGTKKVVSKSVHFVEIDETGHARHAGYAPYLDYRPPHSDEQDQVRHIAQDAADKAGRIEDAAASYAMQEILPDHTKSVKAQVFAQAEKVERAVNKRLTAEIQYWDGRAWELKEKEKSGKRTKISSINAEKRAEELAERRELRLAEVRRSKKLFAEPPRIIGGALVVPASMLHGGESTETSLATPEGKAKIERAAMRAVEQIEREIGFVPRDVSADKCGYDIESAWPAGTPDTEEPRLRMIEVKGRAAGASTVTVSKNEILTALNSPESFILAVVEVDGKHTRTIYLKRPFVNPPDFSTTSVNYDIRHLLENSEVLLEKEQEWL